MCREDWPGNKGECPGDKSILKTKENVLETEKMVRLFWIPKRVSRIQNMVLNSYFSKCIEGCPRNKRDCSGYKGHCLGYKMVAFVTKT